MPLNRIDGNLYVNGTLVADAFDPPANSVGNSHMKAGDPVEIDKTRHLHSKIHSQSDGGSAYDEIIAIHVATSPGVVEQFQAGARVKPVGDSTMTVDLKKNGVSILSDIIDIDNAVDNYVSVVAGLNLALTSYSIGDVFEITVICTDGTGTPAEGLFAQVILDEGPF
jgi:hypothetical protein